MAEETAIDTGNTEVNDATNAVAETTSTDVDKDNGGNIETNTESQEASKGEENSETKTENTLDVDSIKFPESMSMTEEDKAQIPQLMQRFNITTQESMQAFFDWIGEQNAEGEKAISAAQEKRAAEEEKEWEEIRSSWKTTLEKDADFGKEYDANVARAEKALEQFGGGELQDWLKNNGFDGNPAIMKTFARIGKEFEDAKIITGKNATPSNKQPKDRYNQPLFVYNE